MIQKIEAYDLRDDVLNLNALKTISTSELNISRILNLDQNNKYSQNTYSNIREYLKTKEPNVFKLITTAREEVNKWLEEQNVSESIRRGLTGKGGKNEIPFYFFEFVADSQNSIINSNSQEITVSDLLNKLDILVRRQKILAVESIKKPLPRIESQFRVNNRWGKKGTYRLEYVRVSNGTIRIKFIENTGADQQESDKKIFDISVKTGDVDVPSLLSLSDKNRTSNALLLKLSNNKEEKKVIQQTYGILPLKEAQEIASNGLIEAYKKINILGFSISARKFPFAVLFFSLVFMLGTFLTIKEAKQRSLRIISTVTDERAIDILIDNKNYRAILWCVFPVLSVIMSLPIIELSSIEMSIISILCFLLFFLGIKSTSDSRDL